MSYISRLVLIQIQYYPGRRSIVQEERRHLSPLSDTFLAPVSGREEVRALLGSVLVAFSTTWTVPGLQSLRYLVWPCCLLAGAGQEQEVWLLLLQEREVLASSRARLQGLVEETECE